MTLPTLRRLNGIALGSVILPLLLLGVLAAGLLLGRPGHEGIIPGSWVTRPWRTPSFRREPGPKPLPGWGATGLSTSRRRRLGRR